MAREFIETDESAEAGEDAKGGEARSITAREKERLSIQAQIEAYLTQGGQIQEVAPHITADPPVKPESNYSGRSI